MSTQEKKDCKECKVNLLIKEYKLTKNGKYMDICVECNDKLLKYKKEVYEKNYLDRLNTEFIAICNLSLEEVKKQYKYCGGSEEKSSHEKYFKLCFPNKLKPESKTNCLCGHKIKHNCYITTNDLSYDKIVVLGNCCIKRFITKIGRTCEKCGNPHKNKTDNLCNNCRLRCEGCQKVVNRLYNNRCKDCRKCIDCNSPSNGYPRCYFCYSDYF